MSKNKFWPNNPLEIFSSPKVIPTSDMSLEEKMNALTRLSFFIFLILLIILGVSYSFIFLLIALILILVFYYFLSDKKESFQELNTMSCQRLLCDPDPPKSCYFPAEIKYNITPQTYSLSLNNIPVANAPLETLPLLFPDSNNLRIDLPTKLRFCQDSVPIGMSPESPPSQNAILIGCPTAKTNIPPIRVAPSYAYDYWMEKHIVPSRINKQSNTDIYRSGYAITTTCGNTCNKVLTPVEDLGEIKENFEYKEKSNDDDHYFDDPPSLPTINTAPNPSQTYSYPIKPGPYQRDCSTCCKTEGLDCKSEARDGTYYVSYGYPGDVNSGTEGDGCCYCPEQVIENNLPSNYCAGKEQKREELDCYNKRLFTGIIEPGLYTRTEITEPLNSNIGISWNQQFPPITCEKDCDDSNTFVSHDPRIIDITAFQKPKEDPEKVTEWNVYDPRYTGYGTSYRSYIDDLTGRPRFYYDDVDSIRRPNYIVRSKIDTAPWADSYGPINSTNETVLNEYSRALANDKFMRDTLESRTDLKERLLRSYNAKVGWQRRMAPLSRDSGPKRSCR